MSGKQFIIDKLKVTIADDSRTLGQRASEAIARDIISLLAHKPEITIMFAAAPSQNTTLEALLQDSTIPWQRVHALHMDEYVGLPSDDPRSFRYYLHEHLFQHASFKSLNLIGGELPDARKEATRYAQLIKSQGLDLVLLGIGENGHIAFNDPPEARFDDSELVRVVKLSEASRIQQVHDGCFESLEKVPQHAITVTIPAIMSAKTLHCVVPGNLKAKAVQSTLEGNLTEDCPASILRTHSDASLYIDLSSASLLHKGREK